MTNHEAAEPAVRKVRLDHRQVRVLAHPLRLRLLGALRARSPATATTLAGLLDTNTGATSYHLRQLAEVGLVTEVAQPASGRQRWWRAAHDLSSWEPTDFDDDPDARAAIEWIQGDQVRQLAESAERWFATQHEWSPAWRDALGMSDVLMTIPPARLKQLEAEVWELMERYRHETEAETEAGTGDPQARPVQVFLAAYPLPGQTR
ncbi:helix-turn-helix domain-containing protein [Micromonospora sp. KLBMP9576]|uniref:helix-turn-helix domain-containing protein n=1 Tax=Micromonospora sp. KLBMP9576 TaxID=3424769 RepID=UPI003D8BCDB0